MYGVLPTAILKLGTEDFHWVMAMAHAAVLDDKNDLETLTRRGQQDDMAPGIAVAVYAGAKAAR